MPTLSDPRLHPPLRPWPRAWRYVIAALAGAMAWIAAAAERLVLSAPLTPAQEEVVGAALVLDMAIGVLALAIVALRRRYPLAVACLTIAMSTVSVAGMGPMTLAVVSMATWRRRSWLAVVAAVSVAARVVHGVLYRPWFMLVEDSGYETAGGILISLMFVAAAVATGYYVGARRELVASLSDRVLIAEREQALTTKVARDAERTRIAREMHDVLAHRISLVALHAGALAYRDDLNQAQTTETAQTIQANAQLALTELRQVLGVLRGDHDGVERPQPTLAELPALLADAREAGSDVRLDTSNLAGEHPPTLPEPLSRTSFRIVQEAMTNARKHAPSEPVMVRLAGAPGARLELEIRNPVGDREGVGLPSAGVGLIGLAERADLANGTLEYGVRDGSFVVRARLPWPN